jgi:hypothetical protein
MSLPVVSANASNPTRDIDVGAGFAGEAGPFAMQNDATLTKRLDQSFSAGSNAGACDVGAKGANQTWIISLIGAQLSPVPLSPQSALAALSLSRASNVATLTAPGHPLAVGGTLAVGGPNGGFNGFDGVFAITGVTANTISFANSGPDFAAANLPTVTWGYPVVLGIDALASQSANPTMPSGFTLKVPIALLTTDSAGNIASVEPIQ